MGYIIEDRGSIYILRDGMSEKPFSTLEKAAEYCTEHRIGSNSISYSGISQKDVGSFLKFYDRKDSTLKNFFFKRN